MNWSYSNWKHLCLRSNSPLRSTLFFMLTDELQHPLILKVRSFALVMHCCFHTSTLHFAVCLFPSLEAQTEPYCSIVRSLHPLLPPCSLGPAGPAFSYEVAHLMSVPTPSNAAMFGNINPHQSASWAPYWQAAGDESQWTKHSSSVSCWTAMLTLLGASAGPSRLMQRLLWECFTCAHWLVFSAPRVGDLNSPTGTEQKRISHWPHIIHPFQTSPGICKYRFIVWSL